MGAAILQNTLFLATWGATCHERRLDFFRSLESHCDAVGCTRYRAKNAEALPLYHIILLSPPSYHSFLDHLQRNQDQNSDQSNSTWKAKPSPATTTLAVQQPLSTSYVALLSMHTKVIQSIIIILIQLLTNNVLILAMARNHHTMQREKSGDPSMFFVPW